MAGGIGTQAPASSVSNGAEGPKSFASLPTDTWSVILQNSGDVVRCGERVETCEAATHEGVVGGECPVSGWTVGQDLGSRQKVAGSFLADWCWWSAEVLFHQRHVPRRTLLAQSIRQKIPRAVSRSQVRAPNFRT